MIDEVYYRPIRLDNIVMANAHKQQKQSQYKHTTEQANPGLLDAIFASATEYAMITTDPSGNIAIWNKGAEQIFGYTKEEVQGKHIALLFTPSDIVENEQNRELKVARDTGRSSDLRWHLRKDGSLFWADGVMTQIKNAEGEITGFLKILRDETERKNYEAKLFELARIDLLTQVGSRSAFQERLVEMSATALRNSELLILHLLDLDNFKQVNDRWGHPVGDILLKQVAERMRSVIRDTDYIARLGGDEFVILQANTRHPEAGGALSEKLVDILSKPFDIGEKEIITGVSIGIAIFPQDATEPEQLLRKADLALYKIKNSSRNAYHYFSEQLDTEAHAKGRLLSALRRAVKQKAFWLEYQPEIDTTTGKTVAVEALLRCEDQLLADYGTEQVISLAIESGLIVQIGYWVLSEVCRQYRKWQDAGLSPAKVCINVCPRELLTPDFDKYVRDTLKQNKISTNAIEVEITEREVYDAQGPTTMTVKNLRSLGISVAIDDFGSGYSALGQLSNLPIDKLKLDQSFLRRIPADPDSCAIVSAMISLAHRLKLGVVAEGIESAEQAEFFRRENCEIVQGNYFSPPLRGDQMAQWLSRPPNGS
jgi:diguanylate cyclase (GGDEF)-like protein/PAS domain S-box-containing protein